MRYPLLILIAVANFALAQAPGEEALLRGQQKAGAAFRELQQAEYATKTAEQEHRQADSNYKAAQKRADELKIPAQAAQKKLEAAKAREAAARKTYDAAVDAVDRIAHPAEKKK